MTVVSPKSILKSLMCTSGSAASPNVMMSAYLSANPVLADRHA
jgi:hypothetical protein